MEAADALIMACKLWLRLNYMIRVDRVECQTCIVCAENTPSGKEIRCRSGGGQGTNRCLGMIRPDLPFGDLVPMLHALWRGQVGSIPRGPSII
jgi:hypothetical protein